MLTSQGWLSNAPVRSLMCKLERGTVKGKLDPYRSGLGVGDFVYAHWKKGLAGLYWTFPSKLTSTYLT